MIKLIKSTFYNEEQTKIDLIKFIKEAKQLSFGEQCTEFERNFAKYQGRKYCVFLNSGSSANLAIIQTLLNTGKLKKGDTVGFSSLTWSTNVMPLIQLGLNAIPVDIELDTLNVSSKQLAKLLKRVDLKLFFLTNLLGFCDDIDKIKDICDQRNIILIEDNCESLGSQYNGIKLGNFSLASTFSFYVGHHMSTIEGGAVCTDDSELATMLGLVRAHGWDRNLDFSAQEEIRKKFKVNSSFYSRYTFYDLGFNLRPTEINGFLGNNQLKYIREITDKRNKNFLKLSSAIYKHTDKYIPIRHSQMDFISNFAIPLICKSAETRNELVNRCEGRVEIRPIVGGSMLKQPFYRKYMKKKLLIMDIPNAADVHDNGLYFGNNPELTDEEITYLIKIFTE